MNKFTVLICAFLFSGITANAQLTLSTTILDQVTCNGGSNGSIKANPSGGTSPYTYLWSPSSQTIRIAESLTAGTYTITVTDHLGATATATATITQPTAIIVTASAKQSSICPGHEDSLYSSASGGNPPYTYYWTAPYSDISCPSCANTNSFPYGSPYMVTAITDKTGCSATASVSVIVKAFPYVTITGPINPIAPGRSDTLIASSVIGGTYLWSNSSTTSSIIVSPGVSTTYSVKATNNGCYDTAHYTIDTDRVGNGSSSSSPIRIVPSSSFTTQSFSTLDSVVWFSFIPTDSNNQIIANSAYLGYPVPHVHRLTLFNSSLNTVVDEPMPDIQGANQIRIDISHLDIGSTYYVRASRTPAHTNMPGCNPTGDVCNASQRWSFQLAIRTIPIFVPQDSGAEPFGVNQLYYESRGQIEDLNKIPRFDIKAYTNNAVPAVYASDSAVSFVYSHTDTSASSIDTVQRVDMVLTGSSLQPTQPVFKMQEDSNAGYLNYFLGFVPNGVPKVEGYSRLVYKNVYPNVDMHVYSNTTGTKFYFVCNPAGGGGAGGNPANIELKFKGANSVTVNSDSGISIATELGTLSFAPGYAYTDSAGIVKPKSWHANFELVSSNVVRFHTGTYNTNEPLVIEVDRGHLSTPSATGNIDFCTYIGSKASGNYNNEEFKDVYSFNTGVYAAGDCSESFFPVTSGVVQAGFGGGLYDIAIAKFTSPNGGLSWATYFGGSGSDIAYSVEADVNFNVYVTGYTNSADFPPPVTPTGAYHQTFNQGLSTTNDDAFILVLNPGGTGVEWSTFFGGSESEIGYHLALDGLWSALGVSNNLYVVGGYATYEDVGTIPTYTVSGAYNNTTGTGWIAKFNVGSSLPFGQQEWTTEIGGSYAGNATNDALFGCCVDPNNNLWVTGQVDESVTWVTNGTTYSKPISYGDDDGFVAKIDATTNNIDWATYYGGDGDDDYVKSICSDAYNNVFITGYTTSPGTVLNIKIPLKDPGYTGNYYQPTNNNTSVGNGNNAFIAEYSNSGGLLWSTYYGGDEPIQGNGISYQSNCGDVYITGSVYDGGLPIPTAGNPAGTYTNTVYPATEYDGFVASFGSNNYYYIWGTYFGGSDNYETFSNAISCNYLNPDVAIAGSTGSTALPVYNAYQSINYGGSDAYICDFNPAILCTLTGIDNSSTPDDGISVYPNPTAHNITVEMELTQKENVEFILYNAMGQIVFDNTLSAEQGSLTHEIDLSLLPNGIYLLKVNEGSIFFTKKVVKED